MACYLVVVHRLDVRTEADPLGELLLRK